MFPNNNGQALVTTITFLLNTRTHIKGRGKKKSWTQEKTKSLTQKQNKKCSLFGLLQAYKY